MIKITVPVVMATIIMHIVVGQSKANQWSRIPVRIGDGRQIRHIYTSPGEH